MIEWIIGTAVLGGLLFGGKGQSKDPGPKLARASLKLIEPTLSITKDSEYSAWREKWEGEVDSDRWVPKGAAESIIRRFPPFKNGSEGAEPTSQHPRFQKALSKEFDAANAVFGKKQKDRLSNFFRQLSGTLLPMSKWIAAFAWTTRSKSLPLQDPAKHQLSLHVLGMR